MKLLPVAIVIPCFSAVGTFEVWMQTRESSDTLNGLLEFPGGKIGAAEIPAEAAKREILEETGVDLNPEDLQLLNIYTHAYPDKTVSIYAFVFKDSQKKHFGDPGWLSVDSDWKLKLEGRIPDANFNIFEDLYRQFQS